MNRKSASPYARWLLLLGGLPLACGKDNPTPEPDEDVPSETAGGAGGAGGAPAASFLLIDDLEDGDETILPAEGRNGGWYFFSDETQTPVFAVEADPLGRTERAAHFKSAVPFTKWGGGMGVEFLREGETKLLYNASPHLGVAFWARTGKTSTAIRVGLPDVSSDPEGLLCTSCWDHFSKEVYVTSEWQRFELPFSAFARGGFGEPAATAVDAGQLFGLQFQIGASEAVDFWVDDLTFIDTLAGEGTGGAPPDIGPPPTPPVEVHGQLHVDGTKIKDEHGDIVQLRGVSSMWLNWENNGYALSLEGLKWMRDNWHLSVIRAAMGIAPAGAYLTDKETAKAAVSTIVDNAIAAGVYVIIDWHDHEAQNHQVEAEEFFAEMAEKYGSYPNVIYETFNEPLAVSWSSVVKPYHEAVLAKIRDNDPDNLVVLGTPEWSQKVDSAAADPVSGTNLLYTLHFYSCTHQAWLRDRAKSALNAGLPLFVTEWGATHADGGTDGVVCDTAARLWTDFLKAESISWAAWKFDNCSQDSSCILTPIAPLNGPYSIDHLQGHGPFVRERILDLE